MICMIVALCCVCIAEAATIAYLVKNHSRSTELYFRMLSGKEGVKVIPEKKAEPVPAAKRKNMVSKQAEAMDRHQFQQRK